VQQTKQNWNAAKAAKQTTVDDLTRGIVNYKYLGLDFEKAEHERLRYVFFTVQASPIHACMHQCTVAMQRRLAAYLYLFVCFSLYSFSRFSPRFSFTQLDANKPEQKYSFELETTENDDRWTVVELDPPGVISPDRLDELLAPLNDTDDMKSFVRGMRQAFLESIY